jgi:hypothetical protein
MTSLPAGVLAALPRLIRIAQRQILVAVDLQRHC